MLQLAPASSGLFCYLEIEASKYSVSVIFDACKCVDVEDESPEQAADMAYDEVGYIELCHQCSCEVEMGDAVRSIVYDESGEEVADDGYQAMEVSRITQHRDELLAVLEALFHETSNENLRKAQEAIAKVKGV